MSRQAVTYDIVVAALGAMGSAMLDNAARRGLRVLGIERYAPYTNAVRSTVNRA